MHEHFEYICKLKVSELLLMTRTGRVQDRACLERKWILMFVLMFPGSSQCAGVGRRQGIKQFLEQTGKWLLIIPAEFQHTDGGLSALQAAQRGVPAKRAVIVPTRELFSSGAIYSCLKQSAFFLLSRLHHGHANKALNVRQRRKNRLFFFFFHTTLWSGPGACCTLM